MPAPAGRCSRIQSRSRIDPHTLWVWTTFVQPSLTPIAALAEAEAAAYMTWRFGTIQAGIATQQATTAAAAETARNKLKLELFKQRLDLFEAIQRYILTASARPPQEDASPFFTKSARFPG